MIKESGGYNTVKEATAVTTLIEVTTAGLVFLCHGEMLCWFWKQKGGYNKSCQSISENNIGSSIERNSQEEQSTQQNKQFLLHDGASSGIISIKCDFCN